MSACVRVRECACVMSLANPKTYPGRPTVCGVGPGTLARVAARQQAHALGPTSHPRLGLVQACFGGLLPATRPSRARSVTVWVRRGPGRSRACRQGTTAGKGVQKERQKKAQAFKAKTHRHPLPFVCSHSSAHEQRLMSHTRSIVAPRNKPVTPFSGMSLKPLQTVRMFFAAEKFKSILVLYPVQRLPSYQYISKPCALGDSSPCKPLQSVQVWRFSFPCPFFLFPCLLLVCVGLCASVCVSVYCVGGLFCLVSLGSPRRTVCMGHLSVSPLILGKRTLSIHDP